MLMYFHISITNFNPKIIPIKNSNNILFDFVSEMLLKILIFDIFVDCFRIYMYFTRWKDNYKFVP